MTFRIDSATLSAHRRLALAAELARTDWILSGPVPDRVLWPEPVGDGFIRLERNSACAAANHACRGDAWRAEPDTARMMLLMHHEMRSPYGAPVVLSLRYSGHSSRIAGDYASRTAEFAGPLTRGEHALIATAVWGGKDPDEEFDPRRFELPAVELRGRPAGHHVLRRMTAWRPQEGRTYPPISALAARCREVLAAR